jgi:hypothetical protein
MHDIPVMLFMLALMFILASVFLDWTLFRLGHTRGEYVRKDRPVWKQRLIQGLVYTRVATQIVAAASSVLFVFVTLFIMSIG